MMRIHIKAIIFSFFILFFSEYGWSQKVMFVETANVQQAMEAYQRAFQQDELIPGYRVQYLFTNDRREMERVEKEFRNMYNYVPNEWVHDPPYYRLYAGSFLSRANAMRLLASLRQNFPGALLINSPVTIRDVHSCRQKMGEW